MNLRCGNTSNKTVQLVAQHCCVASCRVNVTRITTLFLLRDFVARSRSSFYALKQRKFVVRGIIRATFTLELAPNSSTKSSENEFFLDFSTEQSFRTTFAPPEYQVKVNENQN